MVTITGIGGIGKSRLARQVAHEMAGDFPGGVWLVELDAFETRDEVRAAIRGVLPFEVAAGFPDEPASVPTDMAPLLLILDCFERLLPHAGLVERIVQVAPQVRCLVTSRAILGLPREFEYPLEPMPAGEEADGGIGDPSDSVRLFEEAASHAVPGFRLTPANRESVERLCLALEGIPLSIILAAARLRYLSVAELLSRVRVRRFDVLRRHAPGYDRHAALQQVVADSLALLAPRDQQLLYVLSLFVGGFFLEDAEDVCGPERGADALEGISRLREHSLLSTHPVGDQTRLRLLDTIREYISGLQWDEGTEADLLRCRRRHAAHYAETAQRIDALMQRGQWAEGSALLWREIGNLRAAAGFSIECGDDEMVAVYAESLGRIYHEAGLWEDCDRLADAADAAADRLQRPVLRASMLGLKGAGAARRGDREEARRLWEQRVDLSLSVGDTVAAADQLLDLAAQSQEEGDLAGARRLLRRAIRLVGPHDRSGLLAAARAIQAGIALAEGRPSDARRGADRARDAIRPQADPATALYVYSRLGHIYPELGEADQGEAALRKAIRLAAEGNRDFSLIGALLELGELYESQRQMERAAQVYAVASQIHPELPSRRRDAAAAALARFQRETPGPQIRRLIEDARLKPWQDSLADLLEDPDLARAVAQAASDRPAEPGFYRNAGRATPLP